MKELEQEREDQKSKWQSFNNKAYNKNKKGQVNTCSSTLHTHLNTRKAEPRNLFYSTFKQSNTFHVCYCKNNLFVLFIAFLFVYVTVSSMFEIRKPPKTPQFKC